jgi:hypothetical protein
MKAEASAIIDVSVLPEHARQELGDFYSFLVGKYVERRSLRKVLVSTSSGITAADLAASPVVGIWKDRPLGDSTVYARTLREQSQNRSLS